MDILSHGLWGGIALGRKNKKEYIKAFAWGVMPDAVSFIPFTVANLAMIMTLIPQNEPPPHNVLPEYVYQSYNLTHSLVIFALAFLLARLIFKHWVIPMSAWGLHMLMDIPFHSYDFFATPFLWPLSDLKVDGIMWSNPAVFIPNIVILILLYVWFYWFKKTT